MKTKKQLKKWLLGFYNQKEGNFMDIIRKNRYYKKDTDENR